MAALYDQEDGRARETGADLPKDYGEDAPLLPKGSSLQSFKQTLAFWGQTPMCLMAAVGVVVVVLLSFKLWRLTHQAVHQEMWDDGAAMPLEADLSNLHKGSQWSYLNKAQFDTMVLDAVGHMQPRIVDGDSVFELGVGVGAMLHALRGQWTHLKVGGSNITGAAIGVARKVLPDGRFFVQDMVEKTEELKDDEFDHVISFGALAMYLTRDQQHLAMKEAVRLTKPCGSLLFANFLEPDGKFIGSIIPDAMAKKSHWAEYLPSLGLENIETYEFHPDAKQQDRYMVVATKHCTADHRARPPPLALPAEASDHLEAKP